MESALPELGSLVPCRRTLARIRIRCLFQGATNRLEYNLPPYSCEGDPAPSLAPAAAVPREPEAFADGTGKRIEPLDGGGSIGDVVPVDEPDNGACEVSWGR